MSISRTTNEDFFFKSCENGNLQKVKEFLDKYPVLLNQTNSSGYTALHVAANKGQVEICKLLIEKLKCQQLLIELPLKHGFFARDFFGQTPIHFAAAMGHHDVVVALLEAELTLIDVTDNSGNTCLHLAKDDNVLTVLLEKAPQKLNDRNNEGDTPLHSAVFNGRACVIKKLIEKENIEVNATNRLGQTPLHLFAKSNFPLTSAENIGLLLNKGAEINKLDREGSSPIKYALLNKNISNASLLFDKGAKITDEEYIQVVNTLFYTTEITDPVFAQLDTFSKKAFPEKPSGQLNQLRSVDNSSTFNEFDNLIEAIYTSSLKKEEHLDQGETSIKIADLLAKLPLVDDKTLAFSLFRKVCQLYQNKRKEIGKIYNDDTHPIMTSTNTICTKLFETIKDAKLLAQEDVLFSLVKSDIPPHLDFVENLLAKGLSPNQIIDKDLNMTPFGYAVMSHKKEWVAKLIEQQLNLKPELKDDSKVDSILLAELTSIKDNLIIGLTSYHAPYFFKNKTLSDKRKHVVLKAQELIKSINPLNKENLETIITQISIANEMTTSAYKSSFDGGGNLQKLLSKALKSIKKVGKLKSTVNISDLITRRF